MERVPLRASFEGVLTGMPRPDAIDRTTREALGFEVLRPGQREAIGELLKGRDTLAVLASGAGKSAIYQITALLLERSAPGLGRGEVQRLEAEQVVVLFDTVGYKTLARTIVSERGLLVLVDRDSPADQV